MKKLFIFLITTLVICTVSCEKIKNNTDHPMLEVLLSYSIYEYDANGNIIKESFYDASNVLKNFHNYEYDVNGNKIRETKAEIIEESSFQDYLEKGEVYFFGDGAKKCKEMITHANAR